MIPLAMVVFDEFSECPSKVVKLLFVIRSRLQQPVGANDHAQRSNELAGSRANASFSPAYDTNAVGRSFVKGDEGIAGGRSLSSVGVCIIRPRAYTRVVRARPRCNLFVVNGASTDATETRGSGDCGGCV
jgi:hypothetical protein